MAAFNTFYEILAHSIDCYVVVYLQSGIILTGRIKDVNQYGVDSLLKLDDGDISYIDVNGISALTIMTEE